MGSVFARFVDRSFGDVINAAITGEHPVMILRNRREMRLTIGARRRGVLGAFGAADDVEPFPAAGAALAGSAAGFSGVVAAVVNAFKTWGCCSALSRVSGGQGDHSLNGSGYLVTAAGVRA